MLGGAGGGFGGNPFGGPGMFGAPPPSFPAPGVPGGGSNPAPGTAPSTGTGTTPAAGTGTGAGAGAYPPFNPFLFGFPPFGGAGGSGAGAGATPGTGTGAAPLNPLGMNPAALQSLLGTGAPAQPADTRSPEERFQVQLQVSYSLTFMCNRLIEFFLVSNCKIWDSQTLHRM